MSKNAERVDSAKKHLWSAVDCLAGYSRGKQDIPRAIGHARRAVSLLLMVAFTK